MYKSLSAGAIGVRADLARSAELAGQFGFQGVSVNINEVQKLGVEQAQDILNKAGVRPSDFGLPVDYHAAEADFAQALRELPAVCATAQRLGITRTATWIPSWHDAMPFAENYAFHKDRLGRIAAILKDYGISFGLEFLGPKTLRDGHKYEFIHTMDGMLQLCREIGTGNMGLLFDAFHWYTAGGVMADFDRLTDADVVLVHLNDAQPGLTRDQQIDGNRALPGETGVIGVPAFLQGLAKISYSGPLVVEPFSQRVRAMPAEEAVRVTSESMDVCLRRAGLL